MGKKEKKDIYLLLDANVLLHFPPPDKIKWQDFVDFENLTLLICPQLIREVSDKKDTATRKAIRDRAASREKWIEDIIESDTPKKIRKNVLVDVISHDPTINFKKEKLTKDRPDDWYIASAIQLRSEKEINVGIVSRDLGVKLKLKHTPIVSVRIPDNLSLPTELTKEEKENQNLKLELETIKNRKPDLDFYFASEAKNKKTSEIEFEKLLPKSSYILKALEKEKRVLSDLGTKKPDGSHYYGIAKNFYEEQIKKQKEFLIEVEQFSEKEWEFLKTFTKIIKFEFYLSNSGTYPATNLQVWFSIPEGIKVFDPDEFKKWAKENYPEKPKKFGQFYRDPFSSNLLSLLSPRMNYEGFPLVNGSSARYEMKDLQHHNQYKLDPLYLDFSNYKSRKPFSIEAKILCDEMPNPKEVKLVFKFIINK